MCRTNGCKDHWNSLNYQQSATVQSIVQTNPNQQTNELINFDRFLSCGLEMPHINHTNVKIIEIAPQTHFFHLIHVLSLFWLKHWK